MKIKNVSSNPYIINGPIDPKTKLGTKISIRPGETTEVAQPEADRLLDTYPDAFTNPPEPREARVSAAAKADKSSK